MASGEMLRGGQTVTNESLNHFGGGCIWRFGANCLSLLLTALGLHPQGGPWSSGRSESGLTKGRRNNAVRRSSRKAEGGEL